jgi:hypothetical protein
MRGGEGRGGEGRGGEGNITEPPSAQLPRYWQARPKSCTLPTIFWWFTFDKFTNSTLVQYCYRRKVRLSRVLVEKAISCLGHLSVALESGLFRPASSGKEFQSVQLDLLVGPAVTLWD